ncbi:hypothetical protein AN964_13310 [Heyndrickxia shackletonii]|uniref:Nudix hydrolase domain-containing protein n=1 Tax=Heyndrickxia shackletonii TaxID=157838 RepID=A0A0Q3TL54_9BACI|nr:NUDIX hydrolase [Heyndrickxia shackletonii]KQL54377.1 hypothetical protein AN964_13310 [Heyndrickxia shackletonii]NEY99094.1 NUDIX hydrolase [Heyndrickxia shackletonii]
MRVENIRKAIGAIVYQNNKFLIINKTKMNTKEGKENIEGEWDFIKGGVEEEDDELVDSLLRELKEETGSEEYKVIKQFDEKICFDFPKSIQEKIGFVRQETTMFFVEFLGNEKILTPFDNEVSDVKFLEKDKLLDTLTHSETKEYFIKNVGI